MSLSERIRHHLQSHIVGYLALFVALSGTALALPGKKEVKSDDLANGAVKGKAIAAGAVSTAKVRDGSITAPKLGVAAVTGPALADGSITSADLANDSVIREKIAQGEINGGKLANGAVNSSKVANETLLAEDFAVGQITDGFAISTTPNLSGTPVNLVSTNYTAPRSGRLLVTASTFGVLDCAAACQFDLALYVDDTLVPNSTVTLGGSIPGGGTERTQPTISGILPVTAGAHTIRLRGATTTATAFNPTNTSITGVLLQ